MKSVTPNVHPHNITSCRIELRTISLKDNCTCGQAAAKNCWNFLKDEAKQQVKEKYLARKAKKRKKNDGENINKKRKKFGDKDDEDKINELYEIYIILFDI